MVLNSRAAQHYLVCNRTQEMQDKSCWDYLHSSPWIQSATHTQEEDFSSHQWTHNRKQTPTRASSHGKRAYKVRAFTVYVWVVFVRVCGCVLNNSTGRTSWGSLTARLRLLNVEAAVHMTIERSRLFRLKIFQPSLSDPDGRHSLLHASSSLLSPISCCAPQARHRQKKTKNPGSVHCVRALSSLFLASFIEIPRKHKVKCRSAAILTVLLTDLSWPHPRKKDLTLSRNLCWEVQFLWTTAANYKTICTPSLKKTAWLMLAATQTVTKVLA